MSSLLQVVVVVFFNHEWVLDFVSLFLHLLI